MQLHQRALDGILQTMHNLSLVPRTIRQACKAIPQQEKALRGLDKARKLINTTSLNGPYQNALSDPEVQQLLLDLDSFMKGTSVLR